MNHRTTVLTAVLLLCPAAGWAQLPQAPLLPEVPRVVQDARAVGLLGTWAASCGSGASETNVFVTFYATRKETLRRRIDRGSESMKLEGAVDSLKVLDNNRVRMRLRNEDDNWGASNGQVYDTLIALGGGKLHTLSSIDRAGVELVRNGRYVTKDDPFPTLQRCSRQ